MISASEATDIIQNELTDWGNEQVPIEACEGRVLREEIRADRDFPPFDRVTMDGIAIRANDFIQKGITKYQVVGVQMAGSPPLKLNSEGQALEVMTGAVLPEGATAVVRYEDVEIKEDGQTPIAHVHLSEIVEHQNIHQRATDKCKGDVLLSPGVMLSAAEVAVLATVGKEYVQVAKLPTVAIVATGDELVHVNEEPDPHQIRMSNVIMIASHLKALGVECERFHLTDDYDDLLQQMKGIVDRFDVVVLSGGVSKGKADHVPEVLAALAVQKKFHRVAQRPGKPFWFGVGEQGVKVFALPGNPVSTYMCFVVYFLPWLKKCLASEWSDAVYAILTEPVVFHPKLTYYLQVKCEVNKNGEVIARPCAGKGSGDLSNLSASDAFLELPADRSMFDKGEVFRAYLFRNS